MSTYYTLVPFLLFRVLVFRQRTDNTQTASSIKSRTQTDESDLCARTLLAPRYHSVRLIWDVALSGECVLFVRSYWFDRWLTRQTIILGMQSARSTSSRIRNGPMQIGLRSNILFEYWRVKIFPATLFFFFFAKNDNGPKRCSIPRIFKNRSPFFHSHPVSSAVRWKFQCNQGLKSSFCTGKCQFDVFWRKKDGVLKIK